ncbi:hypothetical protein [Ottowia sp.]|uniref:hypothetical protein n=1 Tax=Ottowia sp. TaxID=1898956 RepID=UPI002C7619AA|nr:hypothetical protein [Ottowia sp.]HOB66794.1 hypothetical protein [Ottowia sp.]HPZ57816.1 hypothetical protein [Ottowia sp.]HQD47006.1 hypothetical protein [Ottowia sp.]
MRFISGFKAVVAACGLSLMAPLALAQPAAAPAAGVVRDETVLDRRTQRVEHIQHEDAGSRVDEVRVGGETRTITVKPKAGVPAYDVQPADASGAGNREAAPGGAGRRVWKLHQF